MALININYVNDEHTYLFFVVSTFFRDVALCENDVACCQMTVNVFTEDH